MDKTMKELPLWYKVASATTAGALAGCAVTGGISPTISSEQGGNNNNSSEIDPTQTEIAKITSATFESIVNNETRQSILNSLPSDRPESNGIEDVFSLKVGDKKFNFVMYELTDEEIANGVTIVNSEGIKTVQSVATYTEFEGYDGTKSWVRLIGITSKLDDPSIVWFYDPNGFPTEERQIDTTRAVFGYDFNSKDNVLYQPLITVPTSIAGYDYTQALPVILEGEIPAAMKVQAMLLKPEVSLPKIENTEAGLATIAVLNNLKVDLTTIELKMDGEHVVCIEKATGNEVCRDGKFELHFVQKSITEFGDIRPGLAPKSTKKNLPNTPTDDTRRYLVELFKQIYGPDAFADKIGFTALMLNPKENGWGLVENLKPADPTDIQYLIFETKDNEIIMIPLMSVTQTEVMYYWS